MGDESVDEKPLWTEAGLKAWKGTGKREQFTDPETGLILLVTPGGSKTFYLVYRAGGGRTGKKRWYKLGRRISLAEARRLCRKALGQIADGGDPQADRAKQRGTQTTVADLCRRFEAEYLAAGKVAASTAVGYRQHIRANILPALGKLPVRTLGTEQVAAFLAEIPSRGQAAKVRATLSRLMSRAELWELRDPGSNPVRGQDRGEVRARKIRASEAQLRAIGAACLGKSWQLRALIVILACTGMRVSELAGNLHKGIPPRPWEDADLKAGVLRLDYHKTVKQAGIKTIYLCAKVVAYMEALPRENTLILAGWKRAHHAWRELPGTQGLNLHDLRHTFASIGDDLGYSQATVGALLGHSAGTQTGRYTHKLAKDLQTAAEAIGGRVAEMLGL